MPATWVTTVHDRGDDFTLEVFVDNDGSIKFACRDSAGELAYPPKMTPFEAGMLARSLEKASEFADTK